jgi:hypothetical protein
MHQNLNKPQKKKNPTLQILFTDDNDEQESGNVVPQFEVQDDGMIEIMRNMNIMIFPDEIIRTNKQTSQIVPLRNIVCSPMTPMEPTVPQLESWAVSDNGASQALT